MPGGASSFAPGPAVTGRRPMMEKTHPQTQPLHPHLPLPPTPPWLCSRSTSLSSREEAVTLLQASRGRPLWLQRDPSGAAQSGTVESGTLRSVKTTASASHHAPRNAAYRERSSCQSLYLISSPRLHLQPPLYRLLTPPRLQLLTFQLLPSLLITRPCITERQGRGTGVQTIGTEGWR